MRYYTGQTTGVYPAFPLYNGDGGLATAALLSSYPYAVTSDGANGFYMAEGPVIRRTFSNGTIVRVAGNGSFGFFGDGGPALDAGFLQPRQINRDTGAATAGRGNGFFVVSVISLHDTYFPPRHPCFSYTFAGGHWLIRRATCVVAADCNCHPYVVTVAIVLAVSVEVPAPNSEPNTDTQAKHELLSTRAIARWLHHFNSSGCVLLGCRFAPLISSDPHSLWFPAGIPRVAPNASSSLFNGMPATATPICVCNGLAADGQGGFFVSDWNNLGSSFQTVRHVFANGTSRIVAGLSNTIGVPLPTTINGITTGDGGPATCVHFFVSGSALVTHHPSFLTLGACVRSFR
jgi:hypothetical protein